MDIDARLEKLERENRRMKKIGIVGIVFASVLFFRANCAWNVPSPPKAHPKRSRTGLSLSR